MSKMCIRMRREDVLEDLPQYIRNALWITPEKIPTDYKALQKKFFDLLKASATKDVAFDLKKTTGELFRMTSEIKEKYVYHYVVDNVISSDEKVILFVKHRSMMNNCVRAFEECNKACIWIDGTVSQDERTKRIEEFLHGDTKFAVLTLGSCSTGLNLIPVSNMVFLELDWTPSVMLQAECRINRIGGSKHLNYTYVLCDKTLDEYVFERSFSKAKGSEFIVDGNDYGDLDIHNVEHIDKKQKIDEWFSFRLSSTTEWRLPK